MTQAGFLEVRRFSPTSLALAAAIEISVIGAAILWQAEGKVGPRPLDTTLIDVIETQQKAEQPKEREKVQERKLIDRVTPEVIVPPVKVEEFARVEWPPLPLVRELGIDPGPTVILPPVKLEPARAKGDVRTLLTTDDYPESARRGAEAGALRARLEIAANGSVTGCAIVEPSGSATLDSTTCRILKTRARFVPAKDGNGQPVSDTYLTPRIVWRLQRDG